MDDIDVFTVQYSTETARLSAEIGRIRTLLSVVVESQREFRAKLDRERIREQVTINQSIKHI